MPKSLNILIVENEKMDIEAYLDTIKTLNREGDGEFIIVPTVKETKEDGLSALHTGNWVAAFIDLKLSTGDILQAQEGNEIVREIYKKMRFPVYVLTNTPEDVSPEFKRSLFLKVSSKDGIDYYEVFGEIIRLYRSGIINILGKVGIIEEMLDNIFWNNISYSLDEWLNIENSEKPLLRYILSHLQEYLEISDGGGGFDTYNPIETYIYPSIKKHPFTGDIFKSKADNKLYVILTPACDLAPHGVDMSPKSDRILLSEIESFKDNILGTFVKKIKKATEEERAGEEAKLMKLITNNYADQYFYLPNCSVFEGGVVNFRRLHSVKIKELKDGYIKVCNLSGQFVKDLIARFSFYYSRQGAPDFNFKSILDKHSS